MKTLAFTLSSVFLLLPALQLQAQNVDGQIIYHTFNGQYEEAEALIQEALQTRSNDPKYYYLKSNLAFYSRYFASADLDRTQLLESVAENAQKAIDAAESMEETTETRFYLGSAYGLLSRAQYLKDRSVFDAYSSARKGKNYLQEVLEHDPDYHDAYLALAVLEYFAATRLTSWWQNALAWISGVPRNKETAFANLERVSEKGSLCKVEADFILGVLYRFFESDPDKASPYLSRFTEAHPQNAFAGNLYKQLQFDYLVKERGVAFLKANIDSLQHEYNIQSDGALNRIGYGFINDNDLQSALTVFQLNVQLYPEKANCYDSLGECFMLLGNNAEAIKNYRIAYEKLMTDSTASEARREVIKKSIEEQLKKLNAT